MINLKQQGSALIVSLIMLTSVTFLAIISLQGSTTQIRIVTNLQIKEDVFHTTKRELNSHFDGIKNDVTKIINLSLAMEKSSVGEVAELVTDISHESSKFHAIKSDLKYINKVPINLNYSFTNETSNSMFAPIIFEINSAALDSTERFKSEQTLGFKYSVPSVGR